MKIKRSKLWILLVCLLAFVFLVPPISQWLLINAAARGRLAEVRLLINLGVDPNTSLTDAGFAVVQSATYNHSAVVQFLLKNGASPNAHISGGESALMFAARYSKLSTVEVLLQGGANPNQGDGSGQTPLTYADGRPDIVQALKRAGARQ